MAKKDSATISTSYSQKYCLVQALTTLGLHDEFKARDWPLHVTIVGVFAIDWSKQNLAELAKLIKNQAAFSTRTAVIEYFGPRGDVKVRLVENNRSLQTCHDDIAHFIERHGGVFTSPEYQFAGFRPHATMRGDAPAQDIEVIFDRFALIDMFPGGDHTQRRVIELFPLSK